MQPNLTRPHREQSSKPVATTPLDTSNPQSTFGNCLKTVRKHRPVISVPVALKPFFWVVFLLQSEEFRELGIAVLNLFSIGETMVGQVIRASAPSCHVDEPSESIGRALNSLGAVDGVQVEDDARIRLLCPGQEALIVALDNADGPVDQFDFILAKVISDLIEESLQRRSWDVDLGDHLGRRIRSMEFLVDFAMVVVGIDAQLMSVRPVHLPIRR